MDKNLRSRYVLVPILLLFAFYLLWLFRAYHDVAYMDQIQFLAGNLNNMYNHDASLHDFYYRPPFLFSLSMPIVFLNCKLFGYNTTSENVVSGLILLSIAFYFIRENLSWFTNLTNRFYFSLLSSLVIFCLVKWEMSLWGGGFSHYLVVALGFICLNVVNKYYFISERSSFSQRHFFAIYVLFSVLGTLETTSYFLPFQIGITVLMFINIRLFRDKIELKKWRRTLYVTIGLLLFTFLINFLAEKYSATHPYEAYGKVNVTESLGQSLGKLTSDPMFALKFFLISHAGALIDKDSYLPQDFGKVIMPLVGLLILIFYIYAIYVFIKRRKADSVYSVGLIIAGLFFSLTVLIGRMSFGDLYYGASSRYAALAFCGPLGLATFFLFRLRENENRRKIETVLFYLPIILIAVCCIIANKNQWHIAPYRKANFIAMGDNYKKNEHLESLMGYNNDITAEARSMMIRNKLNVFKPERKLATYTDSCTQDNFNVSGFHDLEKDQFGPFRWTDGSGLILLPNLYTARDTVHVRLICYTPQGDTPTVILNDNLLPYEKKSIYLGYLFSFAFQEQKVLFKATVKNNGIVPHDLDVQNPDTRKLGLIFRSITLTDKPIK